MSQPTTIKLITTTKSGTKIKSPVTIQIVDNRIEFLKSPFALKDELKAMQGSRWHGYDDPPRKIWTVTNCERNRFQLTWLMGKNPYENWEQPIQEFEYDRPLYKFQETMTNFMLSRHYCIIAAEMGLGKTLSAIECMEKSNLKNWWWIGPKSGLKAVEREFYKWGLSDEINLTLMTYEKLRNLSMEWKKSDVPPDGVIFDESSRLKNATAKRTIAAQTLADNIREYHGKNGYVILMSGTPSPKSPVDWWAQGEIAAPGFLREGDAKAFERRMGIFVEKSDPEGSKFLKRVTWLDDENKCKYCGKYEFANLDEEGNVEQREHEDSDHKFEKSFNEVAYLYERLEGLVLVLKKEDCIDLPEKQYRTIQCKPSATIERVAKALVKIAPNVITGLTWLRELSDGFLYKDIEEGTVSCPVCANSKTPGEIEIWQDPNDSDKQFEMVDMLDSEYVETLIKVQIKCIRCKGTQKVPKIVRITQEVTCPKDKVLVELLEENEEQGRLVVFSGFNGSVDRITKSCLKNKWTVVQVDGRGWKIFDYDGNTIKDIEPLDYWANVERFPRVVFVAHPKSGGMSLTLTEARMAVFYSNSFEPESRLQAEDRLHRIGTDMNKGCMIVDITHLPTDEHVISVLKANRKLELMTLGELQEII